MKVILLGKGKMLANMIESARDSGVEIAGVLRYERTILKPFQLFWHDLFKTSHDLTLIKNTNFRKLNAVLQTQKNFENLY